MKPLRVALFHRDSWYRQALRLDGQFAYPVPQFTWEHFDVLKGFKVDLFDYKEFEVAWLDEGKYKDYSRFSPDVPHYTYQVPLVVMYALYPTLSPGHYKRRVHRAIHNADLVLVDHDNLGRWERDTQLRARRLAYSVNERYYRDRGYKRDIDIGFYYITGFNKERPALDTWLEGFCKRKGYTYHTTKGKSVGVKYAELLARTKVVVHMNRTSQTRPPRIFDAAASGACLLSNPMPEVSGESWRDRFHYYVFDEPCSKTYAQFEQEGVPTYGDKDCQGIILALNDLLDCERWEEIAQNAKQYVLMTHTWVRRAEQLYSILLDSFPKLRQGRESWMFS